MLLHQAMAPAMIGKMIRHTSWIEGRYIYYANGEWYAYDVLGKRALLEAIPLHGEWELYEFPLTVGELLNGDKVVDERGREFEFIGTTSDGAFILYGDGKAIPYLNTSINAFKRSKK